jgi:hypothetical protein
VRAFRRRTLEMMTAKVALVRVAAPAIVLLGAAGCGSSSDGFKQPVAASGSSHAVKQRFVVNGGIEAGPGSGLWGDTMSGPDGMQLGCVAGRHYAFATTIRNRSSAAVTLKSAHGSDPAPGIIRRVAVQFRLAPPPPTGDVFVSNLRRWSAAPATPVTIPPRRSAAVQSNFVMRHCEALAGGRTLVVDGSLLLNYQASGHAGRQKVVQRSARILLTRGPTTRRCMRVSGSVRLSASDVACGVARRAALGCHRLAHRTWGPCSAAGEAWNCTSTAPAGQPSVESCWLVPASRSFNVRWAH